MLPRLCAHFPITLRKLVSVCVLVCFPFSGLSSAAPAPKIPGPEGVPSVITIPEALGQIEVQHFAGPGKPFVFFVQDAHSVLDAQHNIRRLIEYLEREYGVRAVGIEGGEGKLDPLVFRAFPDTFAKEKVMEDYLGKGELTGAGAAAIFSPVNSAYYGIEDWQLYGENYRAYLSSVSERAGILSALDEIKNSLDEKQARIFSPELSAHQKKTADFYSENSHLLEYLQHLRALAESLQPGSAEEIGARYPHLSVLWETVARDRAAPSLGMDASMRRMAKAFQEHYLPKLDRRTQMEFNGMHQQFLSGQMDAGKFLRVLVETGKSAGIQPKLTPEMKDLLGHTERLSQIKGTRLFDELEALAASLESRLIQNPMQQMLSDDYRRLRRLTSLAKLELTRDQLDQYQADAEGHLALLDNSSTRQTLAPALTFYKLALERDRVFHQKMEEVMKKENVRAAAVLAGGFHARGFEEQLRSKGYSFAVMTPRIDSLEGSGLYEGVMTGKLSYGKDVTRSLYEAFLRHASASLVQELSEPDFRKMMKLWRDEVIRLLAAEGRTGEAGEYTRALDALSAVYLKKFGPGAGSKSLPEVLEALDKELAGFKDRSLQGLWSRFESGMEKFFASPAAAPVPGAALGTTVMQQIRTSLPVNDPVLVAVTQGPEAVRAPDLSLPETAVPASSTREIQNALRDLLPASNQGVVNLPEVLELRQQLRLAAQAGDQLGAEAKTNQAELVRVLESRVDEIVRGLPAAQRSQQGVAALKAAIIDSLRQDFAEENVEVISGTRGAVNTSVAAEVLEPQTQARSELRDSLDLGDRYQSTSDYVRLDGIFYVQQGSGFESRLAKAKDEILRRAKDEKIVVLMEGKLFKGNLTFKHHYHTTLSLAQLTRVSPVMKDETLIDLGAGSGVLGITALLRDGARNVLAVDLDSVSLGQAQEALALTEQANGLEAGSLSSRFKVFPISYAEFGRLIAADNFSLLRSESSAHPVIISNNDRPWSIPDLINEDLGPWFQSQGDQRAGLPSPSHIIIAGASFEEDDERSERHERVSRDSYNIAVPLGWRHYSAELRDGPIDFQTTYLGAIYQSPEFFGKLLEFEAGRSELRSEDAAALDSLRQKMAAQVKGDESVLRVSSLGLSQAEMDFLGADIAQLDHEAFGGTGEVSDFKIAKVLGALKRGEDFYVLVDKSGQLQGYIQSTLNEADRSSYLYKLAALPGGGRGRKLMDRYFSDLSAKKIERVGWVADGFSAGFYMRYLTGKLAYNASSAATTFVVDLTTYDFEKKATKLPDEILSLQQAHLARIAARENEVRTLVETVSKTAGEYRISVTVDGETLELPASVDAEGGWTVMGGSEMGASSAEDAILRVLMYNGSSKLTRADGSLIIEASGLEDFQSIQQTSESPLAVSPSESKSPGRQTVLDLFDASIRYQVLPENLPQDFFVLAPVLVKLPEEVDALADVLRRSRESGYLARTIFVDDGSAPELQERMAALREQFPDFYTIQFDRNQQKEVALYAAIDRLRNEYQSRGLTFPSHFVSVDADSALLSPSGNAAETVSNLSRAVEQLRANPGIGAAGIEIQGALTKGKSGFIEWLQAMNYYATMKVGKLISYLINPSIPGGGVIYSAAAFDKAVESTVAKEKSWSYLSGPMKLRDGIAEQGLRIGAPRQEVVVKTKIFPGFLDLVDQQQRWWKISDFPRSLKILLGALGVVLAGSVIQAIINVGILPILASLVSVTIVAAAVVGSFTAVWALQHWLRGDRDQVGVADLLLIPAYITLFFLAIPTALLSRTVTGLPASKISVRAAQTDQPDSAQARSELRAADSIESKLEKIAEQPRVLLDVSRPGLMSRLRSRFRLIRQIPENFPAVILTSEGFRLLTSDADTGSIREGALIPGTEKAAANLLRSGVKWIMGDKLRERKFVGLAGEASFESPEDASRFLRTYRIHQFQESDFAFVRDPRMNDEQEKKLFETARRDLNSMLGDDAALAAASAPFVPLIASYLQNLLAGNYENIQRTLSHHSAYSPDGIFNHLGRDRGTRGNSPGAYKALHFISVIQQYSDKFNDAAGSNIPGRILATDLDLMLAAYYTPEFTHGFLEILFEVHQAFAHKDGQSVFLKNLISTLKSAHHVWVLSDSYSQADRIVNSGLENLQYALTHDSDLKNFLSLYTRLTTRNLTFGDKAFRFESAQYLSETESEAEFQGKNDSFKVNYRAEDGTRQSVLLKNVSMTAVRNDQFATGLTRLIGMPTYRVSVAQKVSEDPRSDDVWEMIQMRPSYTLGWSTRFSGYKAENLDKLFSGSVEQAASRLQQIGAIFAVEYFGARDSKMKHILIDENTGEPFRIDWEFMFFNDDKRPAGMTAKLSDIPHVLAGDERDFLRAVLNGEQGAERLEQVIRGFDQTLGRMMSDLKKGEAQSGILQLVNSVYKDDTRLPVIKEYIQAQFYKPDGTPRTLEEIRTMIGLSAGAVANPSFRRSELRQTLSGSGEAADQTRLEQAQKWIRNQLMAEEDRADVFTARNASLIERIATAIRAGTAEILTEEIGEAGGLSVYRVTGLPESSELLIFTSKGEVRDIALSTNAKEMSYALNGQGLNVPVTDPDARRVNRYISLTREPRAELVSAVLPEIERAVKGTRELDRVYVPAAGLLKDGQSLADMAAESPVLQHVLQSLSRLPAGTSEDNLNFRLSRVYEFAVDESVTNAYFDGRRSHFQMAFRLDYYSDDINPTVYHELQHDSFRALSPEQRERLEIYLLANEPEIHAAMNGYNPVRVLDEFLAHVVEMLAKERREVKGIIFGTEDEIILLKIKQETIEYLVSEGVLPEEAVAEFSSRSELRSVLEIFDRGRSPAVSTRVNSSLFSGDSEDHFPGEADTSSAGSVIDTRSKIRSELRLAETSEPLIPPGAVLYLNAEDLKLLENLQTGIQQDISELKKGVAQRSALARVSVEAAVDGFITGVTSLLREEANVESVVSRASRADFESDLAALLEENALAQGLTQEAAGLLSRELVPQTAGLIRSVLTAAVMTGEMRVLTSSGLVTVDLSPEARALLAKGSRADFEAAYAKLRASGRADLPAQFFLPAETGAKESWFIQSSFMRSDSQTSAALVKKQLEAFLAVKNVPLTFGYTAGTPEERLALELARMFAGTLTVGRKFGEAFRTSKMGYHVNQADRIVFVLNAESGRIQDPLTETSRKARGIVGQEDFISPDLLNHKEYLLLADLVVQSPYLYGQLKSKEGFSFGVMDEEVLNGFLGFLNDLAKTSAAEAAVRASA